jgi:hypothetical protein
MRTSTSYSTRDAYLRRKVLDGIGMDEADLRKGSCYTGKCLLSSVRMKADFLGVPRAYLASARRLWGCCRQSGIRFVAWVKILHKLTLVLRNFTLDHGRGLVGFHYRRRTSCEFLPL